jgi:hypothetical protein
MRSARPSGKKRPSAERSVMAVATAEDLEAIETLRAQVTAQGMLLSLLLRHGSKPAAELLELVRAAAGKYTDHQSGTGIPRAALEAGQAVFAVAEESLVARRAEGE